MLVQLQKNWPADTPPSQPPAEADAGLLSVANLLAILRRRALLIGAAVAAMLVVGVLYLVTTKPMFGSTALVYLDIENAQLMDGNNANPSGMPASLDDVDVNSQLQIIRSEKIALRVIQQLGLEDATEFTRPQNVIVELASRGLGILRSMIRLGPPPPVVQEQGIPRGDRRRVRQAALRRSRRRHLRPGDQASASEDPSTGGRHRQCRGQRLSRGEARRALRIGAPRLDLARGPPRRTAREGGRLRPAGAAIQARATASSTPIPAAASCCPTPS